MWSSVKDAEISALRFEYEIDRDLSYKDIVKELIKHGENPNSAFRR